MKSKRKEIVIGVVLLVILVTIFSIRNKENDQLVEEKVNKEDYKAVALHISEDGTNYNETDNIPTSGYSINTSKSVCRVYDGTGLMEEAPIDNNTIIEYIDHKINIKGISKRSTRCYLYFDKLTDTTKPVISNVTTSVTKTEITVNVTASDIGIEDSVGTVTEYWYQINNNTPIKSTSNSYKFTGLSASTTYTIKVYVKDLAGNQSETTTKSVTTSGPTGSETILANVTVKSETPDFSSIATTDEGVFKTSDGMYGGTTYYWRGATTTNHVIFANKCWRIVRINGDGSIRLIYNGNVQSGTTCTGNGANSSAVIFSDTTESKVPNLNRYVTTGNDYYNSSYVGWTYSLGSQRTLSGTSSNAKTQTEKWYSSNITGTNAEKVVAGKFCNDRNVKSEQSWVATGISFQYAGYERLIDNKAPTLNCTNIEDVYTLKVGAITADEVAFAGGFWLTNNSSYYLYTGQYYWTMSPYSWNTGGAAVFVVYSNGFLHNSGVSEYNIGLRPVINLRSDITFSSGNGTQNSPYVVS